MDELPASNVPLRRTAAARLGFAGARWVRAAGVFLAQRGLRPNQISVLSVVCALGGAVALASAGQSSRVAVQVTCLLLAGTCVQLRLLCNLLDGLVAVEGGLAHKNG